MKQRRSTLSHVDASAVLMFSAELLNQPIKHQINPSVQRLLVFCVLPFQTLSDLIIYYQHKPCRASTEAQKGVLSDEQIPCSSSSKLSLDSNRKASKSN